MIIILLLLYCNSRLYYNILQRTSTRVQGLGRFPCPEAVTIPNMYIILCTAFTFVRTFSGIWTVLFKTMWARRIRIGGKTETQKVDRRYPGPAYNIVKFFFFAKFQLLRRPTLGTNNNFVYIVIITVVQIIVFITRQWWRGGKFLRHRTRYINTQSIGWVPRW